MPETAEDAANANPASPDATSSPVFSPSPPSFWDRSTWDPDSLGAIVFGQPVAPYRSPGQVLADAHDAVLTGPTHPGWSEPITRHDHRRHHVVHA